MKKNFVSVIIPVFNQTESLKVILRFFNCQTYKLENFEVIIIDDGSDEDVNQLIQNTIYSELLYRIKIIRQENAGRAAARNTGILNASGEIVLFNDADRIPDKNFIEQHFIKLCEHKESTIIGCPMDCFYPSKKIIALNNYDLNTIYKFSRIPEYYNKITKIYNEQGLTNSKIAWASYLVGNSSIHIENLKKAGLFDTDFKTWGFEHFELGLRLQKKTVHFVHNKNARNFHIPHQRESNFYVQKIMDSYSILSLKHPDCSCSSLVDFLMGNISLQEFENAFDTEVSEKLKNIEPIYYKNLI